MSAEEKVQKLIKEGKEILVHKSVDEFIKFIESNIIELEQEDNFIESVILWHFVAETMENEEEEEIVAYAYSKLISRYMLLDDYKRAEEMYIESQEKELSSFHLDTVRTIFNRRQETKGNREIIEIHKMDVFGDLELIPASPNTYFENVSLIRRYIHNNLPSGTFSISVLNHKNNTTEELDISTETLTEFEVISINEKVRVD